jgi:2-oxo-3-hexenedioate decarboxylase/2-keto-4-pentenoate hydratase
MTVDPPCQPHPDSPVIIREAARLLAAARREKRPFDRLTEALRPADEAAAYRIQEQLHLDIAAAGKGTVAGYKIGCTTEVMQRYLEIGNPCAGTIAAPTVHDLTADLDHGAFCRPGVECEIAVRLAHPLRARDAPFDQTGVGRAIGAVMPAIELVDDRYQDYRSLDTPTLIADDFFNAGAVLGAPVTAWQALDLAGIEGRMRVNGTLIGTGHGRDILGHPLAALAWLANNRAARGLGLEAGTFILLGSVVQTYWAEKGDRIGIELDGLGAAEVAFV